MNSIEAFADDFAHAFYRKEWRGTGGLSFARLSLAEAYTVQDGVARRRLGLGERVAGWKVGCTSAAIRAQFGLSEPINARIFHPHIWANGQTVDWRRHVRCAIEPEMVLCIGAELRGGELPDAELLDAIEWVAAGIEVHDFTFWLTPPSIQELVCSGGIHAGLVVGDDKVDPHSLTFRDELFSVRANGVASASAPASAIMGGPLHSLRWLVAALAQRGETLRKGSLVIPGSPTELMTIDRDTNLEVTISSVGSVKGRFASSPDGGQTTHSA